MSWTLVSKKNVVSRKDFKCHDCEKDWPAGAEAKNFLFKNEQNEYLTKKICEDCEKYYLRKDLKI